MDWRDTQTSAEMIARYVGGRGITGSRALADFGRQLGIVGVRPDNTVRRWIKSKRCEIPVGLMRRALRDLERESSASNDP